MGSFTLRTFISLFLLKVCAFFRAICLILISLKKPAIEEICLFAGRLKMINMSCVFVSFNTVNIVDISNTSGDINFPSPIEPIGRGL